MNPQKENQEEKNRKFNKRIFRYNKRKRYNPEQSKTQEMENADYRKIVLNDQMISVVIPLYNEEQSLMELSLSLKRVFDILKCNYEVIFVDDGSTDKSFETIKEIHRRNGRYHCIKLRRNYGKSAALSAGFKASKGDIIITMDADLQDDPNEIPELIKKINSGYDLVSGWKKIRYDPFIKKQTSKIFNYFTSKVSGVKLHDFNCGLKAYKKEVTGSIKIYGEMHRYIPALAYMNGFKVTEKIVKHHPRKFGVTKFGANRFLNGFFDLLTVAFTNKFMKKPLHLFGFLGVLSFIAGFIITLYLTILKIFYDASISNRPLFLVGILFIIVGFQSFSLGLIAEMITKSSSHDEDVFIETTL
jgi:glycosyltransferase involved in cell wall biosynthesis